MQREVWNGKDAALLPSLTLAYIGDSVYDVYIRSYLVRRHTLSVGKMNRLAISYVSAEGQAAAAYRMEGHLTEEERDIMRRGRNAKSLTHAKNASIQDYRMATGLEALVGYLYLTGRDDRIEALMDCAIEDATVGKGG